MFTARWSVFFFQLRWTLSLFKTYMAFMPLLFHRAITLVALTLPLKTNTIQNMWKQKGWNGIWVMQNIQYVFLLCLTEDTCPQSLTGSCEMTLGSTKIRASFMGWVFHRKRNRRKWAARASWISRPCRLSPGKAACHLAVNRTMVTQLSVKNQMWGKKYKIMTGEFWRFHMANSCGNFVRGELPIQHQFRIIWSGPGMRPNNNKKKICTSCQ